MSTDYLFARPSLLRGVARVVDLGATLGRGAYDLAETPADADARALLGDWQMLAHDMRAAFGRTAARVAHGQETG